MYDMSVLTTVNPLAMLKLITCLFMSVGLATLSLAASATEDEKPVIQLERTDGGFWATKTIVNGEGQHLMIVDTAAANSALLRHVSSSQGLSPSDQKIIVHGLLNVDDAPYVHTNLRLGLLNHEGMVVLITDSDVIQDPSAKGLIGMDLLRSASPAYRYMALDLKSGRIEYAKRLSHLGFSSKMPWVRQTSKGRDLGFLSFPIRAEGIRATAIIDTGLRYAVANHALAIKLQKRGSTLLEERLIDATGEVDVLRAARIRKIEGAGITWSSSTALIHDSPALKKLASDEAPIMLLGLLHLGNQIIVVDMDRNRLAIMPERTFGRTPKSCTGSHVSCPLTTKTYRQGGFR